MAQTTNFFVGANSGDGFQNLFGELVDLEDTYDLMVLKGGPGVGKNTFMRMIGQTMEQAGAAVEYLWCSGDPDSLDGVVLPELRCAVVDGTSPHGTAPLGHPAKKVSICKALRRRKYYGSSTRHGTNRTLLQDKLFEVRRNCSIKNQPATDCNELTNQNGSLSIITTVSVAGLEPSRIRSRRILSPARLTFRKKRPRRVWLWRYFTARQAVSQTKIVLT